VPPSFEITLPLAQSSVISFVPFRLLSVRPAVTPLETPDAQGSNYGHHFVPATRLLLHTVIPHPSVGDPSAHS